MNTGPQATSLTGRLLALVLRPVFIFFDLTLLGYVLLRVGPSELGRLDGSSESAASLARTGDGYFDWLTSLFPLDDALTSSLEITLQLMVTASLVAALVGAVFGAAAKSGAVGRALGGLAIPTLSLAGPTLGLTLLYWFALRFDMAPAFGASQLSDDPGEALQSLVLPALAVGLPMAPAVGTLLGRRDPFAESYGVAAAGSMLASRSESRPGWRFGFPAGLLVAGVTAAELIFARPGLINRLAQALFSRDNFAALDVLGLFALGGAALAFVIDLIGLRPHRPTSHSTAGLRLAGYSTRPPSKLLLGSAAALMVALIGLAAWGSSSDASELDVTNRLQPPFSSGHLLGTDDLGRDLLRLAVSGIGEGIIFALVPSVIASLLAIGLAVAQERLGAVGQIVPGTVVDALWWPLPILALFGSAAFADSDSPLLHPIVLGLMILGLTPIALRMLRRDALRFDGGGLTRMLGTWFMVASTSYLAYLSASFVGFSSTSSLGNQMSQGIAGIGVSVWPSAVPAVTAAIVLLTLNGLGASLIHLGWHRSAKSLSDELDAAADEVPIRLPNQPPSHDHAALGYDGDDFGGEMMETTGHGGGLTDAALGHDDELYGSDVGSSETGDDLDRFELVSSGLPDPEIDRSRLGPWRYSTDHDEGPLAPNYSLQPGMPQVDPDDDTITMDKLPTMPPPPLPAEERPSD